MQTDVVTAIAQAGFTDAQIVDVAMVIASIAFTNLFNRINDTPLDFPAKDQGHALPISFEIVRPAYVSAGWAKFSQE